MALAFGGCVKQFSVRRYDAQLRVEGCRDGFVQLPGPNNMAEGVGTSLIRMKAQNPRTSVKSARRFWSEGRKDAFPFMAYRVLPFGAGVSNSSTGSDQAVFQSNGAMRPVHARRTCV